MHAVRGDTPVGELVAQRPSRARVFEKHGIDYCCAGRRTLAEACARRQVDLDNLLLDLHAADAAPPEDERDWSAAPLGELVRHIVERHHAFLREALPRLTTLGEKVTRVHGERRPALGECRRIFAGLRSELEAHLMKEEQILFPMIAALETEADAAFGHCGTVANPIAVMVREHDSAGAALADLQRLTDGYVPPADACNTYRAWLDGLRELEADLHTHIHKENNILFPRAVEQEQRGTQAPSARLS